MASVAVPVGFNTTRTCRSLGVARKNPANNHRPRRTLHISSIFPLKVSEEPVPHSVVYRRSSFQTHFECETSLESLGLKQFSTDLTRSLTTSMGLSRKISGDSSRGIKDKKSGDLTLNGIVKTAVCVLCDRCLSPHGAKIFSPFTLLLSRTPVEEPKEQTIGVVLGEEPEPGEAVLDIDLDDKIFFSDEVKSIDVSAYVRNVVTWTSMIAEVAQAGMKDETMSLFRGMQLEGVSIAFVSVMFACNHGGLLEDCSSFTG